MFGKMLNRLTQEPEDKFEGYDRKGKDLFDIQDYIIEARS